MSAKLVRLLTAAVVSAAPLALALCSCTPPAPYTDCGAVDQQPASDVGASEIQQHGSTCTVARQVADVVYRNSRGGPFTYGTWHCTGDIFSGGLGSYIWCNGPGGAVVTWRDV